MKEINKANRLTIVLFAIYLMALFWILVLKFNIPFSYMGNMRRINLVPFSEPLILNGKLDFGEMILNVVVFIPLGMYAGILFRKWIFGKKLLLFFLISFLCESLQLILAVGSFDITDIINNTLGGILGLLIYLGIEKAYNDSARAQKLINIIALTGTILMLSFLLFLKISRMWIFRM